MSENKTAPMPPEEEIPADSLPAKESAPIAEEEEDGLLIILPEDEEEEREYEVGSSMSAQLRAKGVTEDDHTPVKRTLKDKLSGFFSSGLMFIPLAIMVVIIIGVFVTDFNREECDLRVSIFSANSHLDAYSLVPLEREFESICKDYNGDGEVLVDVFQYSLLESESDAVVVLKSGEFFRADTTKTYSSFIYLCDRANYEYICTAPFDVFDSYNGCAEWIPLEDSSFSAAFDSHDVRLKDVGLCLVKLREDAAADEEATARYNNAVEFLGMLEEKYPDIFENARNAA